MRGQHSTNTDGRAQHGARRKSALNHFFRSLGFASYRDRMSRSRCGVKSRQEGLFFEKKKQKTFALALSLRDVNLVQRARSQTDKSFLVPFFKKEHTSVVFSAARRAA
jgi:hypothetical protein